MGRRRNFVVFTLGAVRQQQRRAKNGMDGIRACAVGSLVQVGAPLIGEATCCECSRANTVFLRVGPTY